MNTTHPNDNSAVRVELGERSYDIRFMFGQPDAVASVVKPFCPERAFVITNPTIRALHGERFLAALAAAGIDAVVAEIPDGEKFKTLDTVSSLYDRLIAERFSRRACIVALGGGVVGDIAGFVAATFLRGVAFVQVPTTVVAMVDSSVGGKTGVDHRLGKNLIGAFHQPRAVAIDLSWLRTLDEHNIRGGFAEVIKYGVIYDAAMFADLEEGVEAALRLEPAPLLRAVRRACEIKAEIVSQDEHEGGLRAILNFGHTFAHAIETVGEYRERQYHGQAVAIGMVAACETACRMGLLARADRDRVEALLRRAGLPVRVPAECPVDEILDRMQSDKKVRAGRVRFVLPRAIGTVEVRDDVPPELVRAVVGELQQ